MDTLFRKSIIGLVFGALLFCAGCGGQPATSAFATLDINDPTLQFVMTERGGQPSGSITNLTPFPASGPTEDPRPWFPVSWNTPTGMVTLKFQVDASRWKKVEGADAANVFLRHRTFAGCEIGYFRSLANPYGSNTVSRAIYLGRYNWSVSTSNAYAETVYSLGVDRFGGDSPRFSLFGGSVKLEDELQAPICTRDAEAVFSTLTIPGYETESQTPAPTITATRVFACPDAPPSKLWIGAEVIVVKEVYLRKTPEKVGGNTVVLLTKGKMMMIRGGPVCGEFPGGAYVYWQVSWRNLTTIIGWVAEADRDGPYIWDTQGFEK